MADTSNKSIQLISSFETRKLRCNLYDFNSPLNVADCLKLVYRIAHNNQYKVKRILIDEPYGMDSSWQHYMEDTLQGISEEKFISRYQHLDLEWVSLEGTIKGVSVSYDIGPEELRISFPIATDEQIINEAEAVIVSVL